ncbi:hypothetical protein [Streptomyces albireticuli]|nr:hypothetical protein [Streptomyces albireticuli]MCD9143670.1 hypothetical protein [Streptomyces albireticuli]MCD9161899.1 hypothetical protein [Streptomyces albireticuli]MCD9191787.1 hypothetical protein [Streptomyces albireticuli]
MERASGVPGATGASQSGAARQRAANLRMIALASVVALAIVLPLAAATAGPAGLMSPEKTGKRAHGSGHGGGGRAAGAMDAPGDGDGEGTSDETADDTADTEDDEAADNASGAVGPAEGRESREQDGASGSDGEGGEGAEEGGDEDVVGDASEGLPGAPGRAITRCGPELSSPAGVEAQTCVLERGGETWGRTYFRNATGGPLTAVLTLMGPDGRTVQVHCRTGASDDPDGCETPHRPTVRGASGERDGGGGYAAVAEFASAEGNLLLRSGSNSPGDRVD